ncbi:hypothetical protein PR048_016004 [Dryococelus australis]|uniref:Uncharacterized protein n=1 Tax=Dryococelus australis TaxID=614101 RepID=A0ABQ9HII7_9NEOP|nr:hypothetical protein PR048_016004 [Dryococelus australis]
MDDYGDVNHITQLCISSCKPSYKFSFDSSLCVIEIQNCTGTVTRVKFDGLSIEITFFFFMNLETTTKVLIDHHSSLHQTKNYELSPCVKNVIGNEAINKFNIIFSSNLTGTDNFEIAISGESGKQFSGRTMLQTIFNNFEGKGCIALIIIAPSNKMYSSCRNDIHIQLEQYTQDKSASVAVSEVQTWRKKWLEEDVEISQKSDFIETRNVCDNTFSSCTHINELQNQVRGILPHYVELNHIYSTVCKKTAWMDWH